MQISDLECVISVAESLSFSAAADALFISQSTLSKRITRIEKDLGFALFERSTRSVSLTRAGESLYRDAVEIVDRYRQSVARAALLSKIGGGPKTIKVGGHMGNWRISSTAEALKSHASSSGLFDVKLFGSRSGCIDGANSRASKPFDGIISGQHDICLMFYSSDIEKRGLTFAPLYRDPFVAYVSESNPLALADSVALADLRDLHFVRTVNYDDFFYAVNEGCRLSGFAPKTRLRHVESMGDLVGRCAMDEVLVTAESMASMVAPRSISKLVRLECRDEFAYAEVGAVYVEEQHDEDIRLCIEALRQITQTSPLPE